MYVIASRTQKQYTFFLQMNPNSKTTWAIKESLEKAHRWQSKNAAQKYAGEVESYLGFETNYVGKILVVTECEAEELYKAERNEVMTIEGIHKRWCPSYHSTDDLQGCRFWRDLESMKGRVHEVASG